MKKHTGKIENMPIGATLTGIVVSEKTLRTRIGNLTDYSILFETYAPEVIARPYSIKPNKIEVHDDTIVLMVWYSVGGEHKAPPCEVNIKIGTLVEWEI